jgi:hypothetical protein
MKYATIYNLKYKWKLLQEWRKIVCWVVKGYINLTTGLKRKGKKY